MGDQSNLQAGIHYPGISIVFYCHDGNGNVILAKRSTECRDECGRWDIGAGRLEQGDTIEYTLAKEVSEEYCVTILEYEFLGHRDVHRTMRNPKTGGLVQTHWIGLDHIVLIDPSTLKNGEPHKFSEVRLFPQGDLPSPLHSQLPEFLKKYKDRLY